LPAPPWTCDNWNSCPFQIAYVNIHALPAINKTQYTMQHAHKPSDNSQLLKASNRMKREQHNLEMHSSILE
jgi:hypothetical protein